MTIEEHCSKPLSKVKVVFPGDIRNNMCYAWMMGAAKLGMHFVALGPETLAKQMDSAVVRAAFAEAQKNGGLIEISDHMEDLRGRTSFTATSGPPWARRSRSPSGYGCSPPTG